MLYDRKPDVRRRILSGECDIHDIIAWLETKNPDEAYDWPSLNYCLCGVFLSDHGLRYGDLNDTGRCLDSVFGENWRDAYLQVAHGPSVKGAPPVKGAREGWTFGKALERAKAYIAEHGDR